MWIVRDLWCSGAPDGFQSVVGRRTLRNDMPIIEGSGARARIARSARPLAAITVLALLLGMVALPALAADPSASPDVPGASTDVEASAAPAASTQAEDSAEPEESADPEESAEAEDADESAEPAPAAAPEKPDKPEKGPKEHKDKAPEHEITISGTVTTGADAEGETDYRMQSGGTTYTLEAGPKLFFGDDYPLKPYVGKHVTIVGEVAEGSTEVDVVSVDGKQLREPGKPPWAGGWKTVGEKHPGWSAEKAARWAEKHAGKGAKSGDCWPPGHCKQDAAGDEGVEPTH